MLRGMAASTYIAIRRLWHGYLFFAVYLIIVVSGELLSFIRPCRPNTNSI